MSIILKEIRKKHNLTQTAIADKLGVSRSAIAQIELGKNNISMDLAKKISSLFEVSLDDLINNRYSNVANKIYEDDSEGYNNSHYMDIAYLQLNLDKIEIIKHSIREFAKDKGLRARYDSFNSMSKALNFDKIKDEFNINNDKNTLTPKFIVQFKKVLDACLFSILEDLSYLVSFEYKSSQFFYGE